MKVVSNLTFGFKDLSVEETKLLLQAIKQGLQSLDEESRVQLEPIAEQIQEELISKEQICEGCCDLVGKKKVAKLLCPLSREQVTLCGDCFEARNKHATKYNL